MTTTLRNDELGMLIDPDHGAEVLELLDRRSGLQLLARPPFTATPGRPGDLDEAEWTAAYPGGWQFLTPNAGAACEHDGVRHGFHGRASTEAWEIVDESETRVVLRWTGGGLEVTRTYALDGARLDAETRWVAVGERVPMIATEHFVVGRAMLDPEVVIRLPAAPAAERDEDGGPVRAPDGAPRWPELLLLDGGVERADRWPLDEPRARFAVVEDLPEGWAEVENPAAGLTLRLEWDVRQLPHVWLWHEVRGSAGVWDERAELLGIEPASTPHSLGLAAAVEHEHATWVAPGEPVCHSMSVQLRRAGTA
jgi:galactose mutarotase-like enzyme